GKPAVNALVSVEEVRPEPDGRAKVLEGGAGEHRIHAKSRADSDGRYRFTGLAEGRYSIHALSRAYVSQRARGEDRGNRQVTLDDGEARENVDFEFVQGGVITGRVTDSEGRPVIAAELLLMQINEKGEPAEDSNFNHHQEMQTDDRGVYRIYGLPKGRYIVG